MIGEIISTGDELIAGETLDTNGSYLAAQMKTLGISVIYKTSVGDDYELFMGLLDSAVKRSHIILCTGGLGPTEDDLTREVISDYLKIPLYLDEESYLHIQEIFRFRNMDMPLSNKKQAMIPEGAEIIPNEVGTAPGFWIKYKNTEIIALPGVPLEMERMFETFVFPEIKKRRKEEQAIVTKILNCINISESSLGEKLSHLMKRGKNPLVGTKAGRGIISLRITAKGDTEKEAGQLIAKTEQEIRNILGSLIFGEGKERLEDIVGKLLENYGKTISTAESCTGGLISHKLTNVPGISSYFLQGVVTYSNDAKINILKVPEDLIIKYGAVSSQVAEAMAEGIRKLSGSDFSVAVTGIAGPGGGTDEKPVGLVYIAVGSSDKVTVHKFNFKGNREYIKERTANTALDLLRIKIVK